MAARSSISLAATVGLLAVLICTGVALAAEIKDQIERLGAGVERKMSSYPLRTRGQALHHRLDVRISII